MSIDKTKELIEWLELQKRISMESLSEQDEESEIVMVAMGAGIAAFNHVIQHLKGEL